MCEPTSSETSIWEFVPVPIPAFGLLEEQPFYMIQRFTNWRARGRVTLVHRLLGNYSRK